MNPDILEQLSKQTLDEIDKNTLVDISAVQINKELPPEKRLLLFLEQIKNPYCFLCGETPVKISFADDGPELGELLEHFFIQLKQI